MSKLMIALATAFFIFILRIIYLANTGGDSLFFDFIGSIPYGDKLGHFCLFGTLTFLSILASRFRCFRIRKHKIYYAAAIVSAFVLSEEISQAFIPSRTFDFVDLGADALGILAAVTLAYYGRVAFKQI